MRLAGLCFTCLLLVVGCSSPWGKEHQATTASPKGPATTQAAPFAKEIAAFEAIDHSTKAPAKGGIVFYGSSSIARWKSLSTDFAGLPVINRGFGGSQMDQCVMYLDRAVVGLKPKTLLIYAGDNDLAAGKSVDKVVADTTEFIDDVHAKLPGTRILYLAIKPSPIRAKLLDKGQAANAKIKAMAAAKHFEFVDVATPMLGADGQPKPELFGPDRLHMNEQGYALWTGIVGPLLK